MVNTKEDLGDKKDVDLETLLSRFRPFSSYYLRVMPLLFFTSILNGMYAMNYIFAVDIVDYRCKYPECTTEAYSHLNSTIIEDKCHKYQLSENGTCSAGDFNMSNVEYCKEWDYEKPCSFVSYFQLGCQDVKRGMVATTHSIGYMLGLVILGPISDKYGRKKIIVFTGIIATVMGISKSFAVSYWVYVLSELTEAMFGDSFSATYILGIEMVSKKNRVYFAPLLQAGLSIGGMLLALAAWMMPCWRLFLKVIYAPAILYIFYAFLLDESVRWLLLKNRRAEAKTILAKATKLNKININDETLERIKCEDPTTDNNLISTLKMTLTSRTLLLRFLACVCAWITVTFNKNSLLFIAVGLEGNKYLNYAMTSFADFPASIVFMLMIIKFKRKKPLMLSFLATGAFCILVAVMPKETVLNSMHHQFQLGCQDVKRGMVATTHSIGYMLGLVILGPISDKYGRKKIIVFTGIIATVMGISKSFAVSYWVYVLSELTEAMFGDSFSATYILGIEMVSKKNRVYFAPLLQAGLSIGGMLLALAAWMMPCWRLFLKVIYAPAILYIFYAFLLDESVRWLLLKNRRAEAKTILAKATKLNKININDETLERIKCEDPTTDNNLISTLKMTLTSRTLLLRFLACVCAWITVTFNKNSLLFIAVGLEGNKYLNYAMTSFADFPASIVFMLMIIKFKRKKPLMLSFLATGAFCILVAVMPKGYSLLSTSLFLIGKFMSSIASGTLYLYTSELFPTYTRNTMHGLCSSLGRIGSIVAPHTVLLIPIWSGLPSAIVGILSLTSALIIMMMPDTAESILPDTVKQAEALGIKQEHMETKQTPDSMTLL